MASRIVSVPDGADLAEALAEAVRGQDGWVHGAGFVDGVEVRVGGDGVNPVRRSLGRHAIASLAGPAGGPYGVVLARDGEPVLAGHLVRARALSVTLFVSASMTVHRASAPGEETAPGIHAGEETSPGVPVPGVDASSAPPSQNPWAAAANAAVKEATRGRAITEPVPVPRNGDRVLHFAFGLCDVISVRGSRLHIRDLSGPGRIREIAIDNLEIQAPYEKDGKRVFRLSRKQ
jgi:hypothetical protein